VAVRVRLTRVGSRKNPIWRVVVADQRSPRDGRVIETVGRYNAQTSPSQIVIDEDRVRHWLERGAQPSGTVKKLLRSQGLSATGAPLPGGPRVPRSAGATTTHEPSAPGATPAPRPEPGAPDPAPTPVPAAEEPIEPPTDLSSEGSEPAGTGGAAGEPPADVAPSDSTVEEPPDGTTEPPADGTASPE